MALTELEVRLNSNRKTLSRMLRYILVGFLTLNGCATYTPASVRLNPFGPDVRKAEKGDLVLYAEEYGTREKSERAFDADMMNEGILPILVSIENNGHDPLDINSAFIVLRGEKPLKLMFAEEAAAKAQRGTLVRVLGWSMIVPLVTIPIAIGASALHTHKVNEQIVRDFAAKVLPDGAVLPNKERSGFLFFEIEKGRKDVSGLTLEVTAKNGMTGESVVVEVPLAKPSTTSQDENGEPARPSTASPE